MQVVSILLLEVCKQRLDKHEWRGYACVKWSCTPACMPPRCSVLPGTASGVLGGEKRQDSAQALHVSPAPYASHSCGRECPSGTVLSKALCLPSSQSVVPEPAAAAPPGNLLDIQTLSPTTDPLNGSPVS